MGDRLSMPASLTAENGSKGAMLGEFSECVIVPCQLCDNGLIDGEVCDDCDGSGDFAITVPIGWTNIKEIYKKAVFLHGQPLPQPPGEGGRVMVEMPEQPTREQLADACLWDSHDFGFQDRAEQDRRILVMRYKWRAIWKAVNTPGRGGEYLNKPTPNPHDNAV